VRVATIFFYFFMHFRIFYENLLSDLDAD